jgi:OOP family OmpA-OmpF porin
MYRFLIILSLLFFSEVFFAQKPVEGLKEKNKIRLRSLGKEAARTGQEYLALEYYEELYSRDSTKLFSKIQLAELYRHTRNYKQAERFYQKIVDKNVLTFPESLFYLSIMQKCNGKPQIAEQNLTNFKKVVRMLEDPKFNKLYKSELEGCKLAVSFKDSTEIALVQSLGNSVNNDYIDFSPIAISDTELIYGSLRDEKQLLYNVGDKDTLILPKRKFYTAEKRDTSWVYTGELSGPFNSDEFDVANGSFSLDGTRFYFSKCAKSWRYKVQCQIYYALKEGDHWSEPILMDKNINLKRTTSTHPTVGRESRKEQEVIYFVSDREGGRGDLDIWYTVWDARKEIYKAPKNAGSKINTPGIETTPFYDSKTQTLYYSTNGKPNIGGLDVYKSVGEMRKWEPSVNLGPPVNSTADDLDFTLKPSGKGGYFVSNRLGGRSLYNPTCCDDIYEFNFNQFIEVVYEGTFVDKGSMEELDGDIEINVYLKNEYGGKFLSERLLLSGNKFELTLRPGFDYLIEVKKEGYLNNTVDISSKNMFESRVVKEVLEFEEIPKTPILIKNLNYEFDSPKLTTDSKIILDTTLILLFQKNPQMIVEIASHTDSKGTDTYNLKLSQGRAESVVNYLVEHGVNAMQLKAKGYGETMAIAPNENTDGTDNPEGRRLNRRTEFTIIGTLTREIINLSIPDEDESEDEDSNVDVKKKK